MVVDVLNTEAGPFEHLLDGKRRGDAEVDRSDPSVFVSDNSSKGFEAFRFGSGLGHKDESAGTVVNLAGVGRSDSSSFGEGRLQ